MEKQRGTRDPFRGHEAVGNGDVTRRRLAGPDFVRTARDVHLGADTDLDVRVRVLGVALRGPGDGVVAGPLAALAWGAECPWDDAELVLRTSRAPTRDGVRVRVDRLPDDEVAERWGVPVTSPLRTAFDLARRAPLVEAVAAVDALAFRCRFGPDDLAVLAARHPRARGLVQLRRVLELMDRRSESLMETRMRLLFVLRGLHPVPQLWVRTPDRRDRRLDLAWPDVPPGRRKVAAEYDGPEHRTIAGQNRDAFRDAALDLLGWDVVHVTSAMVLGTPEADDLAVRVARKVL